MSTDSRLIVTVGGKTVKNGGTVKSNAGNTLSIKSSIVPEYTYNPKVSWTSSDKSVAEILYGEGKILLKKAGTTKITCSPVDAPKLKMSFTLEVKEVNWKWPVDISYNLISGEFHQWRTDHWHNGIDISCSKAKVYASKDGTVAAIYNGNSGARGRYIIIEHSNGYYSVYQHLSKVNSTLQVGTKVKKGQEIGISGGSGYGSESAYAQHLHFEVLKGEKGLRDADAIFILTSCNPSPLLKRLDDRTLCDDSYERIIYDSIPNGLWNLLGREGQDWKNK